MNYNDAIIYLEKVIRLLSKKKFYNDEDIAQIGILAVIKKSKEFTGPVDEFIKYAYCHAKWKMYNAFFRTKRLLLTDDSPHLLRKIPPYQLIVGKQ